MTIRNVHIRYEDATSPGYDFAAGFTLKELKLSTGDGGDENLSKVFSKHVNLTGLGVYWTPKVRTMYSSAMAGVDMDPDFIEDEFNKTIGTKLGDCPKLQYLLGPINSSAKITFCQSPVEHNFK